MIIQIPQIEVRPGNDVPYEARSYLTFHIWEDIIRLKLAAIEQASCQACCMETLWCVCLFPIGALCFCLHPACMSIFLPGGMNDSMTYLNQIYFQNNAVLSMDPQFLYINVNLIPSTMLIDGRLVSYVVPAAGHTVYYPNGQALVYTRSGREVPVSGPGVAVQPAYAETYYPPAHVRPVDPIDPIRRGVIVPDPKPNSTGIRTMVVTIPEGTIGGTVLTVQAPDGTQVQATVPSNAIAGQEISVQY